MQLDHKGGFEITTRISIPSRYLLVLVLGALEVCMVLLDRVENYAADAA